MEQKIVEDYNELLDKKLSKIMAQYKTGRKELKMMSTDKFLEMITNNELSVKERVLSFFRYLCLKKNAVEKINLAVSELSVDDLREYRGIENLLLKSRKEFAEV
ncbi:hypothetical protein LCGC14_2295740 [marine sediment metagenome]|uniref:Uncharacterized protein n=1 Tax=marine sediment metagenome TaxID=412755 RepID=A0A0F9FK21_9ZZZZ